MPRHDIVVIGGSAGGVEALVKLVRDLPEDLAAAVFVVIHFPADSASILADVLEEEGRLPSSQARDGDPIRRGRIYVAQPDYHLRLEEGRVRLDRGPRENRARPAIDVLFRSAAAAYGPRVVGVVLSGSLYDGALGMQAIKRAGGVTIVQDPEEAAFRGMPDAAMANGRVDYAVPVAEIAPVLVQLSREEVKKVDPAAMKREAENTEKIAKDIRVEERGEAIGTRSMFSCPDCGGALWELQEGDLVRFQCHVGHAYGMEALLSQQRDEAEQALWTAVRVLEEQASLSRTVASRLETKGEEKIATRLRHRAEEAEHNADVVRKLLTALDRAPVETPTT